MKAIRKNFGILGGRWTISALILYQFLFFNILIPGHKRGLITVDGKHTSSSECCCCVKEKPAKGSEPSPQDKENCAICNFAAHVMPTPFPNLKLPELRLLGILPPSRGSAAVSLDVLLTYQSRGPPAVL